MSCDELSDADSQNFAVIANGEFIKTNPIPATQDPSDWLDLVDHPSGSFFTWKFGAFLALGVVACCAAACAWRRFIRSRRHRLAVSKYRRKITTNRGGAPPPSHKLQPYDGPVRHPGELNVSGPGRFQESWRRPGPESIGGRSMRSMRSEQSARGALLTGAGALVPGQFSEGSHEACPECGLRLPDRVQLARHVETRHGGRATHKRKVAAPVPEVGHTPNATTGLKVVRATASKKIGNSNGVPAVTLTPSRDVPRRSGTPLADALAAASADLRAKPASISPVSGSLARGEPRPRLLPHKRGGRGGGGGEVEVPRESPSTAAGDSVTDKASPISLPVRVTTGAGAGSVNGGRPPTEASERSAALGKPLTNCGDEQGRGREREAAPGCERPGSRLVKEDSARSLTRTSSLDRMSALSSRAIARSTSQKAKDENSTAEAAVVWNVAGGGDGGGGGAHEAARAKLLSRRRIRRSASTEDAVPSAHRLTADGLRALGSGLPENFKLPPSVFSPVKASAKEPAYSPVARERAGELDKERPVSITRKFFRQLAGDG